MEKKLYPFKFIPVPSRRPWGGNALKIELGKHFVECDEDGNETVLGDDVLVGESWELADMGIEDSVVANGWLAGNTISELMETYLERIVGEDVYNYYGRQFPLLIKFLDLAVPYIGKQHFQIFFRGIYVAYAKIFFHSLFPEITGKILRYLRFGDKIYRIAFQEPPLDKETAEAAQNRKMLVNRSRTARHFCIQKLHLVSTDQRRIQKRYDIVPCLHHPLEIPEHILIYIRSSWRISSDIPYVTEIFIYDIHRKSVRKHHSCGNMPISAALSLMKASAASKVFSITPSRMAFFTASLS